jgi:hypothetical protein
MTAILINRKEEVYNEFAKHLADRTSAIYLYNVLGMLCYEDFPKGFDRKDSKKGYYALIFWGNESYGKYDTRCCFDQPVALDERWLFRLAENPHDTKPKVTLQTYNRRMGGVKYEDYDEMLLELLPLEMETGELKKVLSDYFSIRAKSDDGETSLYRDAKERFSK